MTVEWAGWIDTQTQDGVTRRVKRYGRSERNQMNRMGWNGMA